MFPTLNSFLQEGATNDCIDRPLQVLIAEYIISLRNELCRYFPQTPGLSHTLVKTPFCSKFEDVPEIAQDEFIDMLNSECVQTEFENNSLMKFWIKKIEGYPILSETVLRVLMPYPSTYMCENAFSTLLVIKSKARNRLEAENDLRCALSKTTPRIERLVQTKQQQISH